MFTHNPGWYCGLTAAITFVLVMLSVVFSNIVGLEGGWGGGGQIGHVAKSV